MYRGSHQTCFSFTNRRGDPTAGREIAMPSRSRPSLVRGEYLQKSAPSRTVTDTAQKYDCSFTNCIEAADGSAARLVNILAEDFSCFRDESRFEGKTVRILKRAQILVADLWACFNGEDYGAFDDIEKITIFAGRLPFSFFLFRKFRIPRQPEACPNRQSSHKSKFAFWGPCAISQRFSLSLGSVDPIWKNLLIFVPISASLRALCRVRAFDVNTLC